MKLFSAKLPPLLFSMVTCDNNRTIPLAKRSECRLHGMHRLGQIHFITFISDVTNYIGLD